MADQIDEYHYANVASAAMSKISGAQGKTLVSVVKEVSPSIVSYLASINIDMRTVALGADGYLLAYHAAPLLEEKWTALVEYHSRFAEAIAFSTNPSRALFITCDNATPVIRSLHDLGASISLVNGRSLLFFERFINDPGSATFIPTYSTLNFDDIFDGSCDTTFDFIYSQLPAIEEHWDNLNHLIDILSSRGTLLLSGAGLDGASAYAPSESGFEQHPYYFIHSKLQQRNDIFIYNFNFGFGATVIVKI